MSQSPFYFKKRVISTDVDAQMIPCGIILDCNGNPLTSKVIRTAITSGTTYTQLISDFYIGVNVANAITITLLAAASWSGRYLIIKDESGKAGTYNITVDADGSETIDGDLTYKIVINYQSVTLYSNGTSIFII
jgi:hypothetical protein